MYHKRLYCYHNSDDPIFTTELHGFSDTSLKACGCSIYLRFANRSKFVKIELVASWPNKYTAHLKAKIKRPVFQKNATK